MGEIPSSPVKRLRRALELADRDPQAAARQIRPLPTEPAGEAGEHARAAATICAQLRRQRHFVEAMSLADDARAVAAEGTVLWRRLVLEAALAACASGDEAGARARASLDARTAAILAPLLAAISGTPVGRLPRGASKGQRGLHRLAKAVTQLDAGRTDRARQTLSSIPRSLRRSVPVELARGLVTIASSTMPHARTALTRILRTAGGERLRDAAVFAAAERFPELAARAARGSAVSPRVRAVLRLRSVAPAFGGHQAGGASPGPPAGSAAGDDIAARRTAMAVAAERIDAFAPADRPAALAYRGFGLAFDDRERSDEAFDQAIAAGADLAECYRGRLVNVVRGHPCISDQRTPPLAEPRLVAERAEQLARLYDKANGPGPLVAVASAIAARGWIEEGQSFPRARQALARARELAGGELRDDLDLLEALSIQDHARTGDLCTAITQRNPRHVDAWQARIDLARLLSDREGVIALTRQGAAATGDPDLVRDARRLRPRDAPAQVERGASAGTVAAEIHHEARARGNGAAIIALLQSDGATALSPDGRLAVAVAAIGSAVAYDADAEQVAQAVVEQRLHEPSSLGDLIAAVSWILFDEVECFAPTIIELASRGPGASMRAVEALLTGLIRGGGWYLAQDLLAQVAAHLDARALRSVRTLLDARRGPGRGAPPPLVKAACDGLLPELDLLDLGADDDVFEQDEIDDVLDLGPSVLAMLLEVVGLPENALHTLSPERRTALESEMRSAFMDMQDMDPRALETAAPALMDKLLDELGLPTPPLSAPSRRPARRSAPAGRKKLSRKERNQRKRRKRKR